SRFLFRAADEGCESVSGTTSHGDRLSRGESRRRVACDVLPEYARRSRRCEDGCGGCVPYCRRKFRAATARGHGATGGMRGGRSFAEIAGSRSETDESAGAGSESELFTDRTGGLVEDRVQWNADG